MASWFSKINNIFPPKSTPPPQTTDITTATPLSAVSSTDDSPPSNTQPPVSTTEKKGPLDTISTGATTILQQPTQSIYKFGSFLSNIANKVVEKIEDERLKLLTEQERINITDIESTHVKPPWLDIPSSDTRVKEEVRVLILGLTRSKRNFLNAPPEDIDFPFNYKDVLPVAIASLQADQRLDMARFCLVPMYLKEEMFWRNWFYRVHTIMAAYGLHFNINKQQSSTSADVKELEVGSSAAYLDKDLEQELSQLGVHTAESNPEAWEAELRAELESMTEKGLTDALSENWEEELRKELGIKDDISLSLEIERNTKETTPLTVSSPQLFKPAESTPTGEVTSRSPPRSSRLSLSKEDILDSSSEDEQKLERNNINKQVFVETMRPDLESVSVTESTITPTNSNDTNTNDNTSITANNNNNNSHTNNANNNGSQNLGDDQQAQEADFVQHENPRSPDNAPGPDPTHDISVTHTPSYRTSTSLHINPDDETPLNSSTIPDNTIRPDTQTTTNETPDIATTSQTPETVVAPVTTRDDVTVQPTELVEEVSDESVPVSDAEPALDTDTQTTEDVIDDDTDNTDPQEQPNNATDNSNSNTNKAKKRRNRKK